MRSRCAGSAVAPQQGNDGGVSHQQPVALTMKEKAHRSGWAEGRLEVDQGGRSVSVRFHGRPREVVGVGAR